MKEKKVPSLSFSHSFSHCCPPSSSRSLIYFKQILGLLYHNKKVMRWPLGMDLLLYIPIPCLLLSPSLCLCLCFQIGGVEKKITRRKEEKGGGGVGDVGRHRQGRRLMGQSGAPLLLLYLYLFLLSVCLSISFRLLPARFVLASMHQPTRNKVFRKGESKTYLLYTKNQARHRRKQGTKNKKRQCKTYEQSTKQKQQGTSVSSALLVVGVCYVCCLAWTWSVCVASTPCTSLLHMCHSSLARWHSSLSPCALQNNRFESRSSY